ncbi:sugar ABC transporter ATP-binding protein [Herbiconiux sp. YIM B11900]|uniref:sugar ABC transporter ATP-binding protein n=1 Tax=Herbiconiux sp. YIM B11900 TaxID=3404131 RepID=UPI003F858FDE
MTASVSSLEGLTVSGLRKSYGPNIVLRGIDLEVQPGRIHALLGANGAGKSTLLGCLSGATTPDAGVIRVASVEHAGFSPRQALEAGIAIIYQHFQLIGELSVADNVFLGSELRRPGGITDRRAQAVETARVLAVLGVDIDPSQRVDRLSVGEQQMVEIARAVRRTPSVLILDEPTAALGTHEIDALLQMVDRLAHETGIAVIYVTHLLHEVLRIADDVTVLRDGAVLWTRPRAQIGLADLVEAISPGATTARRCMRPLDGPEWLMLNSYLCGYTGPIDLKVQRGEILGVYGMLGSGRTDLLETLAGVRVRKSGEASLAGAPLTAASPRKALDAGIALVASDRVSQSLFGEMPVVDNLLMPHLDRLARGIRRVGEERREFSETVAEVGVTPPRGDIAVSSLSGGNAQKVAVARWTTASARIELLLLDEPTQGVDIGSRSDIYALLRRAAENGTTVIFASSDPEEIITLADRVLVLVEGRVAHHGDNVLSEDELTVLAQPMAVESAA